MTAQQQQDRGVPIGALRIPAVHAHAWQSLVRQILGNDAMRFRGVELNKEEQASLQQLVVHLQPSVCRSLDDGHADLVEFLAKHLAEYLPGVRRKQMPTAVTREKENCAFKFAEMFAGIGGFRLGLEPLGGKCVVSSEKSASAAAIYRQNFGDNCLSLGDIFDYHATDLPGFDMLTAGFPCQPFSNRGHQRGLEDHAERGHLYQELVRILDAKQPASFLFENVAGLVTMDGGSRGGRVKGQVATVTPGKVLERILAEFASCGYQVDWRIVNSRHWLPQQRERVYIVGTRLDLECGSFQWDDLSCRGGNDTVSSLSTVRDILEPRDCGAVLASELNKEQWTKVQRLYAKKNLDASRDGCIDLDGKAPTLISQYHRVGSFSTKYVFEEADGTPRNKGGLLRPRFFTPRECCRLQGFPESFQVPSLEQHGESQVAHFYRGIGNAVTPPVVTAIATRLLNMLGVRRDTQESRVRQGVHAEIT
jgi:DNA (cytosine-5)-methyltransferase 1